MNSSALFSSDTGDQNDSLAFLSFKSAKKRSSSLSRPSEFVLESIVPLIDDVLHEAIICRTADEFRSHLKQSFAKYAALMLAYGNVVFASINARQIAALNYQSLLDLEAHLRDEGGNSFGSEIKDQAVFAAWTLRKINDIVAQMRPSELEKSHKEQDQRFAREFVVTVLQARFALDCLLVAATEKQPIYPEVLSEISLELRAIVNAYACAKQGLSLRKRIMEVVVAPIEWDDEDSVMLGAADLR